VGYTTDFEGSFSITPPLQGIHRAYLAAFAGTRRMQRDSAKTVNRDDRARHAVGLGVGLQGGYFVGEEGFMGQGVDRMSTIPDVVDQNQAPSGQPSLWCHWAPSLDGSALAWDGSEKFSNYVEWLNYLIQHFLKPWGYALSGTVEWQGEDHCDKGRIVVNNNTVKAQRARVTSYEDGDDA